MNKEIRTDPIEAKNRMITKIANKAAKEFADEVMEEVASFPAGDHDDYVDSMSQALIRFRQGGWIRSPTDDWDDEPTYRRPVEYY